MRVKGRFVKKEEETKVKDEEFNKAIAADVLSKSFFSLCPSNNNTSSNSTASSNKNNISAESIGVSKVDPDVPATGPKDTYKNTYNTFELRKRVHNDNDKEDDDERERGVQMEVDVT